MQHTERTQNAHTQHREQNTEYRYNNMQHREQDTEQNTENSTQDNAQPKHTCSAHNYRTYSLDYYFEYAYIKNSDTIEIYTILK